MTASQWGIVLDALNIGFLQTLRLFFATLIGAIPLGLVIMFARRSSFKPLSWLMQSLSWIIRGSSIPQGQEEAGLVLGMTRTQIFFKVKLLQMVKAILPPMSNEVITLVKDTSLSRIIALQEVIWAGQKFLKGSSGIAANILPLLCTAVYYLVFNGLLTLLLARLEKRLGYFR